MTLIRVPEAVDDGYAPFYGPPESADLTPLAVDPSGQLVGRATVLTDEGTFRVNFANSSLAVSLGAVTVSGDTVTGTGFDSADIHSGDYFKISADAEDKWVQVDRVLSATQVRLVSNYAGSSSGTGERSLIQPTTNASGGASISVASGQTTLASGTAAGVTRVCRQVDCAPVVVRGRFSVSQRIASQEVCFGAGENALTPKYFARFKLDGTTNTTVKCETARNPTNPPSAAETETTAVTIPFGRNSSQVLEYRIEALTEVVKFFIEGVQVAVHSRVLPHQHDELAVGLSVENLATVTSTSIVCDYITAKNHNRLEIGITSETEAVASTQPPVEAFSFTQAGAITINTDLIVVDCSRYRSLWIQCITMGTSGVVTPAWSNDGVNWVTATLFSEAGASSTTFNAAVLRYTNVIARYFRLRLTTGASGGTTAIFLNANQIANQQWLATQPVSGTVTATVTSTRIAPNAADGHSTTHHAISANSTNATSVKNGAGAIGLITVSNINAAVRYFKLYNKASAPTVGTDTPVMTVAVPPNQTLVIGGNSPIRCGTGIAYALTTGITVADTGAVAASEMSVSIFYT